MDDVEAELEKEDEVLSWGEGRMEGGTERHKDTEGGGEMEGMIMSGNVRLSIRIWTPINNLPSVNSMMSPHLLSLSLSYSSRIHRDKVEEQM